MKTFKSIILSAIVLVVTGNLSFGQNDPAIKVYHSIEEGLKEPEKVEYLEIENISDEDSLELLSHFPKLHHLSLVDFHSSTAPESISKLKGLKVLRFVNDDFYTIPSSYSNLTNLTRLEFIYDTHLNLQNTFSVINKIPSLIELKIEGLPGPVFSDDLVFPSQIQHLSLRNNHLNQVPAGVFQLSRIQTLDLGNNEFFNLPIHLSSLVNLNTIYLDRLPYIKIDQLFSVLNDVPKLQFVHLEGNHLDIDRIEGFQERSLYQVFLDENLTENSAINKHKVNLLLPEVPQPSKDPSGAPFSIPLGRN